MLDFRRADAATQGAKRSIRGCMTIAAKYDHARSNHSQFGRDDMFDPLERVIRVE